MKKLTPLQSAIVSYLAAHVAARDAKRLIDIGRSAATEEHLKVIVAARGQSARFEMLIEVVAAKEALDIIDLHAMDPRGASDGCTANRAYATALKRVRSRYPRGRCELCKGPARACALRHAEGKSCA